MNRFTATISDSTNPDSGIDTLADDPGELLRKIQGTIQDAYGSDLQAAKNLTVSIVDTRDPDHALMVKAPSAAKLIEEVDEAIRNTYRNEVQT